MSIESNINSLLAKLEGSHCNLIAVSKTKPNEDIMSAYQAGIRVFGENKVQELTTKHEELPKDIEWHMIGHLQSNKVKYIASFVHLIHGVDSFKLLKEINKQATKHNRVVQCLLQIHIADEATKFGFNRDELDNLLESEELKTLKNIKIVGLMGMATNTSDTDQVRNEFKGLKSLFDELVAKPLPDQVALKELSMGMSADYQIAIEEGSTLIRVGSAIFGSRK